MRALIPTVLALALFATSPLGRRAMADLTLWMAKEAGDHQHHMMRLTRLNHSLAGAQQRPAHPRM